MLPSGAGLLWCLSLGDSRVPFRLVGVGVAFGSLGLGFVAVAAAAAAAALAGGGRGGEGGIGGVGGGGRGGVGGSGGVGGVGDGDRGCPLRDRGRGSGF